MRELTHTRLNILVHSSKLRNFDMKSDQMLLISLPKPRKTAHDTDALFLSLS